MSVDSCFHTSLSLLCLQRLQLFITCVCVCVCSFLCRGVATDEQQQVAVLSLPAEAEIQLSSERGSFFLVRVVA